MILREKLRESRIHDDSQTEMLNERFEIPVVVKPVVPAFGASGGNHRIHSLAERFHYLSLTCSVPTDEEP